MNKGTWAKQPRRHEANRGEGEDERGKVVEVVPSNESLLLAESWIKGMTGGNEGEEEDEVPDFEARPLRLGLGAKFLPHSHMTATMSMVEKKLKAKIGGELAKKTEYMNRKQGVNHGSGYLEAKEESKDESGEESDDDKSESRAQVFSKKAKKFGTIPPVSTPQNPKKKKKRKKKGNGNLSQT